MNTATESAADIAYCMIFFRNVSNKHKQGSISS
jgi:hypothetical protein